MNAALLAGAIVGVAAYLVACARSRTTPAVILCVESILLGAGVPSGIHLIYCAFNPDQLVHVTDGAGKIVNLQAMQFQVHLGEFHAVEILIGGFIGAFFCVLGLITTCKKAASASASAPDSQHD